MMTQSLYSLLENLDEKNCFLSCISAQLALVIMVILVYFSTQVSVFM